MRHELLQWYRRTRRDLPWRRTEDPYAIWVSEIMLQQTRVATVKDRYSEFLVRFPTIESLAAAEQEQVLALWSGLGYYRRARTLHQAAQVIVRDLAGNMPSTSAELSRLPGIGPYTAAAIASIAHSEPVAAVDGNVERVLSRIRGWHSHDARSESRVRVRVGAYAALLVDPRHPGDFNQAMMELGATVCTPRNPGCLLCPWAQSCRTLGEHGTPRRPPMTRREITCALATRNSGASTAVLLVQRHRTNSVMPGMWELPVWSEDAEAVATPAFTVRHAIMQVNYTVHVQSLPPGRPLPVSKAGGRRRWVPVEEAASMALTGLARKILVRAGLLLPRTGAAVIAPSAVRKVL